MNNGHPFDKRSARVSLLDSLKRRTDRKTKRDTEGNPVAEYVRVGVCGGEVRLCVRVSARENERQRERVKEGRKEKRRSGNDSGEKKGKKQRSRIIYRRKGRGEINVGDRDTDFHTAYPIARYKRAGAILRSMNLLLSRPPATTTSFRGITAAST